jgi:hypothetical protein
MNRILAPGILALFTLCAAGQASAAGCNVIEDQEARACCEKNQPRQTMEQLVRMSARDDKGTLSELSARLRWKRFDDGRSRARIDLTNPPHQSGTAVLLTERETADSEPTAEPEVVLYTPGERRDRLITVSAISGEMFGSNFSYEDISHFYGTNENVKITRLEDGERDGHRTVVLQSEPTDFDAAMDNGATYARVVTHLDAERCVPLLTQFYEEGDELRKELSATESDISPEGERWVAHRLLMKDLADGTSTELVIDKVVFDPEMKDRLFQRSSLKRGR